MNESNAIFLSTFDGFFEQKLKEPKPGCVQRVNKNNETINVLRFNTLIGKIVKIEYKKTEKFGDFWSITFVDDRAYKLDLAVASSSTFYFLNRLINADLDLKAPVELKVFAEVEDDKKKTVILLKQAGKMIGGVYTKDNPQDLPPMEQVMFKGKLEWDSTKRDQFLRDVIEKYVVPELDATAAPAGIDDQHHSDGPPEDTELPEWAKDNAPAAQAAPTPPTPPVPPPAKTTPPKPAEAPKVTPSGETKAPAKRRG